MVREEHIPMVYEQQTKGWLINNKDFKKEIGI
jgi:hypothetical protein